MQKRRFLPVIPFVYLAARVTEYIIEQVLRSEDFLAVTAVMFNTEEEMIVRIGGKFLVDVLYTTIFSYLFVRGWENRSVMEGVRFGMVVGVFFWAPLVFFEYVSHPVPEMLAVQWVLSGVCVNISMGIVAARMYRQANDAPHATA